MLMAETQILTYIKIIVPIIIVIIICVAIKVLVNNVRRTINRTINRGLRCLNNADMVVDALKSAQELEEERPRSLQGMDSAVLPSIMKDFPDFNVNLAKTAVKDEMAKRMPNRSLTFHNVVIKRYNRFGAQKVIIFQTAFEYMENGHKVQKRYELDYAYILLSNDGSSKVAGNCPNCGAPLQSLSSQKCMYCDSIIGDVQGFSWKFTDVKES